jgi:HECT-domain (ubiquitin-transferase)
LDFTVTSEHFGLREVAELAPGGAGTPVTDANKDQYLTLMLRHRYTVKEKECAPDTQGDL